MGRFRTYNNLTWDTPEFIPDFNALRELQDIKQKRYDDVNTQTDLIAASINSSPMDEQQRQEKLKDLYERKDLLTREMINNPSNGAVLMKRFQDDLRKDILFGDINTMNKRKADFDLKMQQLNSSPYAKDPTWKAFYEKQLKNSYGDFYSGTLEGKIDDAPYLDVVQKATLLDDFTKAAEDIYQEELKKDPTLKDVGYAKWFSQVGHNSLTYQKIMAAALPKYNSNPLVKEYWNKEGQIRGLGDNQGDLKIYTIQDAELVKKEKGESSPEYLAALSKVGQIDDNTLAGQWLNGGINAKTHDNKTIHYQHVVDTKQQQADNHAHDMQKLRIQQEAAAQAKQLEVLKEMSSKINFSVMEGGAGKINVPSLATETAELTKQKEKLLTAFITKNVGEKDFGKWMSNTANKNIFLNWLNNTTEGKEWNRLNEEVKTNNLQLNTALSGTSLHSLVPTFSEVELDKLMPHDSKDREDFLEAVATGLSFKEAVKKYPNTLGKLAFTNLPEYPDYHKYKNLYETALENRNSIGIVSATYENPATGITYSDSKDQENFEDAFIIAAKQGLVTDLNRKPIVLPAGAKVIDKRYSVNAGNSSTGSYYIEYEEGEGEKAVTKRISGRVIWNGAEPKKLHNQALTLGQYNPDVKTTIIKAYIREDESLLKDLTRVRELGNNGRTQMTMSGGYSGVTISKTGNNKFTATVMSNGKPEVIPQNFDTPDDVVTYIVQYAKPTN